MAESQFIKDGTDATFMADVVEASKEVPVIVDFWAPWCGPCKQLGPALEAVVDAAGGKVKMVKVNVDENQGIAGQLQVRSIPTVYAFVNGQPVDGFVGGLPASQLEVFVNKLAGVDEDDGDAEALIAQGHEQLKAGDTGNAAQSFAAALQEEPNNGEALAGLARCYLMSGEPAQAKELIDSAAEELQNHADIEGVRAALALAEEAGGDYDMEALAAKVKDNPEDHDSRFALAKGFAASGDLGRATDHLLEIIRRQRDWNDEAARKYLLKIFEAAGFNSDISVRGRKRLSSVLFS